MERLRQALPLSISCMGFTFARSCVCKLLFIELVLMKWADGFNRLKNPQARALRLGLRIHLPIQGPQSLIPGWEDSTSLAASMRGTAASEPASSSYWHLCALGPERLRQDNGK